MRSQNQRVPLLGTFFHHHCLLCLPRKPSDLQPAICQAVLYLSEAEDVVHEEQHVLALVTEVLGHSETCVRWASMKGAAISHKQ